MAGKQCLFVIALVLLLMSACATQPPDDCCGSRHTVTREVVVFEDSNGNGLYDEGESPIPDVLISYAFNEHGASSRETDLTDQTGAVTFTRTYTHHLDIASATPCGYTPTTPTAQSAEHDEIILFGFKPVDPQQGQAEIRFFVWLDTDEDGQHDPNELPLPHTQFPLGIASYSPDGGTNQYEWSPENYDELMFVTGDDGWGSILLGNTCGPLLLLAGSYEVSHLWQITDDNSQLTRHEVEIEYRSEPFIYYDIEFGLGKTIVLIVVKPSATNSLNIERRTVYVFEDTDADGQHDSGEPMLPNVPVLSSTWGDNVGEFDKILTDDNGKAVLDAFYHDDSLSIEVVSPCGYKHTTTRWIGPQDDDPFYVGFAPEQPQSRQSTVRLHLWHDRDGDGRQDPGDSPVNDAVLSLWLKGTDPPYVYRDDDQTAIARDDRLLVTDEEGWIEFPLGNTCEQLNVDLTFTQSDYRWHGWLPLTFSPEPLELVYEKYQDYFRFDYGDGDTLIEIGLVPGLDAEGKPVALFEHQVQVFEDADHDGQYDAGENPIPNVLVYGWVDFQTTMTEREVAFTDVDGQAVISTGYHPHHIISATPCGMTPTTPTMLQVDGSNIIHIFGFAPDDPQTVQTTLRFFSWQDDNQDGKKNRREPVIAGMMLQLGLAEDAEHEPWESNVFALPVGEDPLTIMADEDGWGEIYLGNTCQAVHVQAQHPNNYVLHLTAATPEPVISQILGKEFYTFKVIPGMDEILMGFWYTQNEYTIVFPDWPFDE